MSTINEKPGIGPAPQGRSDLDRQYRKIGLSALAGALPYNGAQKNPNYEPAKPKKILTIRDVEWLLG